MYFIFHGCRIRGVREWLDPPLWLSGSFALTVAAMNFLCCFCQAQLGSVSHPRRVVAAVMHPPSAMGHSCLLPRGRLHCLGFFIIQRDGATIITLSRPWNLKMFCCLWGVSCCTRRIQLSKNSFFKRSFLQCRKFSLVESQCESQQSVCTVLKAEKKGKLSLYLEDGKCEVYK